MSTFLAFVMGVLLQAPQFEVISIKPRANVPGPSLIEMPPTGRINFVNANVRTLLRSAYRIQDYQIVGAPDWAYNDRFDVQAKPTEKKTP